VEYGGSHWLVDCGLYYPEGQGSLAVREGAAASANQCLPARAAQAQAVIITHAHLDHIGRLRAGSDSARPESRQKEEARDGSALIFWPDVARFRSGERRRQAAAFGPVRASERVRRNPVAPVVGTQFIEHLGRHSGRG
jgi:glyoxylase-like metal-dependent hydrolase (beta-lactamase superfamily II)